MGTLNRLGGRYCERSETEKRTKNSVMNTKKIYLCDRLCEKQPYSKE